ncbi:DinB family protein [Knoellia sp. 3-2P3]|uniref:DinB family protein n=1 Tax=unclassified Knoellia TaxID=2618719 RepID=UPI0031F46099
MPETPRKHPDMWVEPDADPRHPFENVPKDERGTYADYLRHYRLTLEMKCEGLSPEQMATRSVPPSTMSLLGLVRHMAEVERSWFRRVLSQEDAPRLWGPRRSDADWDGAVGDAECVEEAWKTWREEVAFAEQWVRGNPDMALEVTHHGDTVSARDVLVHMVEEYARHCGHADLLRECIDGRTGQ